MTGGTVKSGHTPKSGSPGRVLKRSSTVGDDTRNTQKFSVSSSGSSSGNRNNNANTNGGGGGEALVSPE